MSITTSPLFTPVTMATAPEASKPLLESIRKSIGFIPNMMATFANNPVVLQGYLALEEVFERGSFTPKERQIILLATSVENDCNYCTAAHSTIAQSFLFTSAAIVAAVLNGQPVPDTKLNALVAVVTEVVRERGNVRDKTLETFIAAGYKKEQVMELLLGIALKTISNYLDHICPTAIDQEFKAAAR
jgi:uncharacterized peroxidase-related enzyme